MRSLLAIRAIWAEPSQVEVAQLAADVLFRANRPKWAKAHVVVWARRQLRHGIEMEIEALFAVGAVAVSHEKVAFRHLSQIIFVQEFARNAFFAEPAQPMLADKRIETARGLCAC